MLLLIPSWIITLALQLAIAFTDPFLRELPELAYTTPEHGADEAGIATTYGRTKDSHHQAYMAGAEHMRLDGEMHVCAHRTHTFGTRLLLRHKKTRRTTYCVVRDRGPYGCRYTDPDTGETSRLNLAKLRQAKDPRAATCRPNGILDLSPAVRAALGPDGSDGGRQHIEAWVISSPKRSQYIRPAKVQPKSIRTHDPRPAS